MPSREPQIEDLINQLTNQIFGPRSPQQSVASVHTTNIFSALVQAWLVLVQPVLVLAYFPCGWRLAGPRLESRRVGPATASTAARARHWAWIHAEDTGDQPHFYSREMD